MKKIKSKTLDEVVKPTVPVRMSYETYAFLKNLVELQKRQLESDFRTACFFIPNEPPMWDKRTGMDKAHKIFGMEYARLDKMLEEIHVAAASTYKDHPNPEMRKFWGLKQ